MKNYLGQQIDRYRITERLGIGGMAVVYKAYDTRLERDVALKLIRAEAIPPEQYARLMKRFEREAKAQARFAHPNIISVYDYGEVDGSPYLVMAYIPGNTLKVRIGQPVNWVQALSWLIPIADALQYAHERNIIHRDIKPSNILFDERDQPILTDFGIAKLLETDEATLTGTGLGVGTPEYMAPEQWRGQAFAATDQYALGVVLYELLTGQKPYKADTPAAVAIMQATEPLRSPRALAPGIPKGVEKLLFKTLAQDPHDRYEDIAAFRAALENQLISQPNQASKTDQSPIPELAVPAPQPMSEAETVDELMTTPVESLRVHADVLPGRPAGHAGTRKNKLAGRLLWAAGAFIAVVFLVGGMALLARGSRSRVPVAAAEPTEEAVAQVEAPLFTPTEAQLPTATETPLPSLTATEIAVPTLTLTPELALGIGSTMVNPIDGAVLVYVPEGEFLMGSEDEEALDSEKPQRSVYLDAFWIYQTEVTNAQYRQCVEAGVCIGDLSLYTDDDYPVREVVWYQARDYCQWAGGRLLTEAEWEKAARGTDGRKYPWGDESPTCSLTFITGCSDWRSPVGSYPDGASPYGVLDMVGNKREWVADWFNEAYYSYAPYENPTGPVSGDYRVGRGGSWHDDGRGLRVSYRYGYDPGNSFWGFGFRCVHTETP